MQTIFDLKRRLLFFSAVRIFTLICDTHNSANEIIDTSLPENILSVSENAALFRWALVWDIKKLVSHVLYNYVVHGYIALFLNVMCN